MVLRCVVPECKNSSRTPGISFHCFPSDEKRKKAWFLRLKHRGKVSAGTRVCSAHFLPEDYRYISNSKKFLKDNAEPSVFSYDTSQETQAAVASLSCASKSKEEVQVWEPQEKIIVPPLEEFLEVPLEYIRNKRRVSGYFHLKEKTATFFPFDGKKNVLDSCIRNETSGSTNINQSHSIYDVKTLKWLKRTKKTKKLFINYFAAGMSPAVAIQHHESMLSLENPDLVHDGKRNPPTAWVYSLYNSWLKQQGNKVSVESEKIAMTFDAVPINLDALVKVPIKNEVDPVVRQRNPQAPCIIHMNNDSTDDYEDLKHLEIPDKVKKLFHKYFDAGLDVSEAKKLNEENLKRNKNWPQFNPSERVVNYIYELWYQQIKSCDDVSSNSGFISPNEKNYMGCNLSFESSNEQMDCQTLINNFTASSPTNPEFKESETVTPQIEVNSSQETDMDCQTVINNFTASSPLATNPKFKESETVAPQAEVNSSQETDMELLPFSFIPSTISSDTLVDVQNDNIISGITKDIPLQTEEKLYDKMPVDPKVDYAFDSVQNQFITASSVNSVVAQANSAPVFINSFNTKTDFSNNQISVVSVMSETKTFDSVKNSSVLFHEEKRQELSTNLNKPCYYSDFPYKYPFQTVPESSRHTCQTTFSDSFNRLIVSNYCEPPVMRDTNIFHPITIYGSNICFDMNSENDGNEHFTFYPFLDKDLESVSRMTSDVKELNHIYSTTELDSRTNSFLPNTPAFVNGYTIFKEMPYKSKMDDFVESEEPNYPPAEMNTQSINSRNNEMDMSFADEEENDFAECNDVGHFKIAPLEFSKQNEDQKFLMSLLPVFECIPDCFKVTLKHDIFDLVHSTKLKANKCHTGMC